MDNFANQKLMDQYKWIIPERRISLTQVIDKIKTQHNATMIEYRDIPNLWMHKSNAVHLPSSERLQLTADQLNIQAIKIKVDEMMLPYTEKDFTPVRCDEGDYIYVAYEDQVGYWYSNSNRLYLEIKLMQGISREAIAADEEEATDFFFGLKTYDELYAEMQAEI